VVFAFLLQTIICREDGHTLYIKQLTYLAGNHMSCNQNKCVLGGVQIGSKCYNLLLGHLVHLRQLHLASHQSIYVVLFDRK
jgi:hypothetical protein